MSCVFVNADQERYGTLILLADSLPLFPSAADQHVMDTISSQIESTTPRAAYLGASNRDNNQYYEIFCAAMAFIPGIQCRHIHATYTNDDLSYLDSCDIVLLAGGSVEVGWASIGNDAIKTRLQRLYETGKTLVGVSAGAIQLGVCGFGDDANDNLMFTTLAFAPYMVAVHDEADNWSDLKCRINSCDYLYKGLGIGRRSGVILQNRLLYSFGHVVECLNDTTHFIGLIDNDISGQPC